MIIWKAALFLFFKSLIWVNQMTGINISEPFLILGIHKLQYHHVKLSVISQYYPWEAINSILFFPMKASLKINWQTTTGFKVPYIKWLKLAAKMAAFTQVTHTYSATFFLFFSFFLFYTEKLTNNRRQVNYEASDNESHHATTWISHWLAWSKKKKKILHNRCSRVIQQ